MACQMASLVYKDGFAFGIHGQAGANSNRSHAVLSGSHGGRKIWEERGYGVGTVILVDDKLVVLEDREEGDCERPSKGFGGNCSISGVGRQEQLDAPHLLKWKNYRRSSAGTWGLVRYGKRKVISSAF